MNAMTRNLLIWLMRAVVGGVNWKLVVDVVQQMESVDVSGAEKRELAITALKNIVTDVSTRLLNLALEAAVVWIKSKSDAR